jgi:hypothetical protein
MNGHVEMEPAAALLFVRSRADLRLALEQVNGLLALRRHWRRSQCRDRVLAVCFGRDLDSRLPPLRTIAEETGSPNLSPAIQESVSLAGIWTLSWLSGPALRGLWDSLQQREAILRTFASVLSEADSLGSFCPVFAQDESPESVAMETRCLEERYPQLAGLIRFRQDSRHGVYCEEEALP